MHEWLDTCRVHGETYFLHWNVSIYIGFRKKVRNKGGGCVWGGVCICPNGSLSSVPVSYKYPRKKGEFQIPGKSKNSSIPSLIISPLFNSLPSSQIELPCSPGHATDLSPRRRDHQYIAFRFWITVGNTKIPACRQCLIAACSSYLVSQCHLVCTSKKKGSLKINILTLITLNNSKLYISNICSACKSKSTV